MKKLSIIILAAGKGKRMKNDELPKVMVELNNKPLLEYVLNSVSHLELERCVIVVGHKKEKVIEYFKQDPNLSFATQEEQLGTGHAVVSAHEELKDFDGNTLILLGDVPMLKSSTIDSFITGHTESGAVLSVMSAITNDPTGYGRIVRDSNNNFTKITEHKDASEEILKINEINSGIFLVDNKKLFSSLSKVRNANAQNEYYLTDIVEILKNDGEKISAVAAASFDELRGINSPEDLHEVEKTMELK